MAERSHGKGEVPGSLPGLGSKVGGHTTSDSVCDALQRITRVLPPACTCSYRLAVKTLAFHASDRGFESHYEYKQSIPDRPTAGQRFLGP